MTTTAASDAILMSDLVRAVAARRWLVAGLALFCGVAAGAISFALKPIYSADVLLAPTSQNEPGAGGSSLSSQFAGLASLAGIGISSAEGAREEAIATLQSRVITDAFIRDHDLLPTFFEGRWDESAKRWKSDDPKKVPTLWDGTRYFDHNVRTVKLDKKTGLVTLTIRWTDPEIASSWANEMVMRTNSFLRSKAIDHAANNLQFLQQQLDKTAMVEIRQAIFHLMENEIKTLTLAEGNNEYAFKVIDPAVTPHLRISPDRKLITLCGIVFGLVIGGFYAVLVPAPAPRKAVKPDAAI